MSVREFLKQQAKQYRIHQNIVKEAQITLNHQYQQKSQGTIPKKHRPKPPKVVSEKSRDKHSRDFHTEYR